MSYSPRTAFSLTALALTLTLAACSQPAAPQANAGGQASSQQDGRQFGYDGKDRSWTSTDNGLTTLTAQALGNGDNLVSDLPWLSATSGWGPIERNMSNGEAGSGDGRTLTLNGRAYATGLGVHANSSVTFALNGQCERFTGDIGMDDEIDDRGSVVFQVYADGVKLYDSGRMTGTTAAKWVDVNITGRKELKLVVTDAGDNYYSDHADWTQPTLRGCKVQSQPTPPAPTPPAPSGNVQYVGPLVITKGGTYRGNWQSLNPDVPAVFVHTSEPVVIEGSNIRGTGHLIRGWGMNLTVRNSNGYGMNPNIYGRAAGRFIVAEELNSLRVENNYLEGTTGIYTNEFYGKDASQTIKVLRNRVKNIDGRQSNGNGGYLDARAYVQFVQLAKIWDVPGIEIAWNEVINEPGVSSLEENINLYSASGTAASRIQIHDNFLQGAYAINPATDGSYSGGGIMLGDGVADNWDHPGSYVDVYNNQIVSTSNQGIGISGGHNHNVYGNRVLSSGRLPDGQVNKAQNVGIYVWDTVNGKSRNLWYNNTVHDNVIGWTRVNANNSTWQNNTWFADCTNLCYNNKTWSGAVTNATEQQEFQLWQGKFRAAGLSVGPN
ncbi:NPCBM/NEW2 domain-containing protein [Deinococcus arenicola]|uniref:NPCBM/NEW2 domain-containing protein n=1 Tax=Deinococcus arenicola TaxID=2994950 RepID=A0ABU4DLF3_9DEIO|nr:NPCBM/NEW2 domain-containing protein [Deinococcus sp. ZS9-10]MDV6373253.1 NPCBM/NEW2 domain-containing protein [Deinococcus sp. ZS9-10]